MYYYVGASLNNLFSSSSSSCTDIVHQNDIHEKDDPEVNEGTYHHLNVVINSFHLSLFQLYHYSALAPLLTICVNTVTIIIQPVPVVTAIIAIQLTTQLIKSLPTLMTVLKINSWLKMWGLKLLQVMMFVLT